MTTQFLSFYMVIIWKPESVHKHILLIVINGIYISRNVYNQHQQYIYNNTARVSTNNISCDYDFNIPWSYLTLNFECDFSMLNITLYQSLISFQTYIISNFSLSICNCVQPRKN